MTELFESFCRELLYLKNRSPKTIRSYRQAFQSLQQSLGETVSADSQALTKAQLQAWIVTMRTRGLSPGACNVYIRSINSFLGWLHEQQPQPRTQERLRLQLLKETQQVCSTYDDSHIRLILSFRPRTFGERRIWTLVLTCLDTGIRIDEALTLRAVDMDNLLLTILGKGNKERIVPFSAELRKNLFVYCSLQSKTCRNVHYLFSSHSGSRYSYRNAVRDFKKLKMKLGLPEALAFHQLRHSFATGYLRNGGDVVTLSRILGHSSLTVTMKYQHLLTEDLQRVHSRVSPLSRLR